MAMPVTVDLDGHTSLGGSLEHGRPIRLHASTRVEYPSTWMPEDRHAR